MQTRQGNIVANRYKLGELHEQRGPVYLYDAFDERLDRPVTVQMLEGSANRDLSRAFLRHQQIASSIHNCPVRTVYDAGTWQSSPFSVLEREKGRPVEEFYRPGYPPDVPAAISIAREVAESLDCCREAGLSDWTFSPEAVRIDQENRPCLAVIEGLGGPFSSASSRTDAVALIALLKILLLGRPNPTPADLKAAMVPEWLTGKLAEVEPSGGAGVITAGDFARKLESVETVSSQPTEAYTPPLDGQDPGGAADRTMPVANVLAGLAEAPTLAAKVPDPGPQTQALPEITNAGAPYVPPVEPLEVEEPTRRARLPLLAVAIALALLLALGALTFAKVKASQQNAPGVIAAPSAPHPVAVPDLRGKTLDDARNVAGSNSLNLSTGQPMHGAAPPNTVLSQQPAPGASIQSGELVTVSLSLGPEDTPTPPPAQPVVQPAAPPPARKQAPPQKPAPQPPAHVPPGHDKGHDNGGKHGKGDK